MNARVRGKIEMAARVQEFSKAHPVAGQTLGPILARLADELSRAREASLAQEQGSIAARSASKRQLTLRRSIRDRLYYVLAVGGTLEGFPKVRAPRLHSTSFTDEARTLLNSTRKHEAALLKNGLSAGVFDDVERLLAELHQTKDLRRSRRMDQTHGRIQLQSVGNRLASHVRVLDGLYRFHYGDDVDLIAEWDMIRKIPRNGRGRAKEDETRS
jgi:hypothetical protein